MAFPPGFLDELRERLSVAEIVGRTVRLQKRGREYVGLCPFHKEKSPSFTVSDEKGFFHCFGCGAHGDVVGFLMRTENLPFPEAVERLAQQAGLPVPAASPVERAEAQRRATLLDAVEAATRWFEGQLQAPAGRAALAYLAERGLSPETMARFRLGFAPDARASLRSALAASGIPLTLMVEAGLLVTPEGGGEPYDRFRGRVIFPIADRRGRIVAFGGRILGPGEPKYLNSPETPLFHKGRMLYGLAQARGPASDKNELVVGEGYMDVIALSQAGFVQSVAPLGTALTEDQLALLWQLAPEPTLCFDGDAAGQRAAARALDRALPLLQPGRSLRFALLPAGEDPDSLVRQSGATAMREILDRAAPLDRMLWDLELAAQAPDTPERQAGLKLRLSKRIAVIAERSVAEAYRREMDRRFTEAFAPSARSPRYQPERGRRPAPQPPHRTAVGGEAARRGTLGAARLEQEVFLMAVINHPVLLARHLEELAAVALPSPDLDRLRRAIIDVAAVQTELDAAALRDHLGQQGFAEELSALAGRTRTYGPARPDTSLEDVEEFLRQVIGLLRDREAVAEARAAANHLASAPDDQAAQVRRVQQAVQGGESRRREDDGADPSFGRRNES